MQKNPLDEIRSSLVMMIFLGVFVLIIPELARWWLHPTGGSDNFTLENLLMILSYVLIGGLLWLISLHRRDELAELLMDVPDPVQRRDYLWLSVGMIISAIGFTYLLFYPLSLLAPELVEAWLLDDPYLLYWDEESNYLLGNLLGIIMAIILAPVLEELLFRGYLLNRWTLKMGALPAMLLSSALFAVLHTDMLGAFVFAVFMCLLAMKTRSLAAPILVHMANNVLAVALEWFDQAFVSGFAEVSISDFQAYLWLGIICMLIGFPWLWLYARRNFFPLQELLLAHEQGDGEQYRA
ncbi:MAG: CPBP family intramembrane glutamic endopeptidase [Thiolinea sp.]